MIVLWKAALDGCTFNGLVLASFPSVFAFSNCTTFPCPHGNSFCKFKKKFKKVTTKRKVYKTFILNIAQGASKSFLDLLLHQIIGLRWECIQLPQENWKIFRPWETYLVMVKLIPVLNIDLDFVFVQPTRNWVSRHSSSLARPAF